MESLVGVVTAVTSTSVAAVESTMNDVIGLGIIAPYLSVIVEPDRFFQSSIGQFIIGFGLPANPQKLNHPNASGHSTVQVRITCRNSSILRQSCVLHYCQFLWRQRSLDSSS